MVLTEFLELDEAVIIATKGLPCTGKSEIGRIIGQWAKCPVLYIDHFLDTLCLEKGYTAQSLPSWEESERLHRLAFDGLCKAASDNLQWGLDSSSYRRKSVVVKSRLSSTFEVNRLVQLGKERGCGMILIIEFQMKNVFRYQDRFEDKVKSGGQKEWYKPRSWKDDIEKAMDDYYEPDININNGDGLPRVTRLVLDPFDDLFLVPRVAIPDMAVRIINHLLGAAERVPQHRELVVQYGEVGRYLREEYLGFPRSRGSHGHKYLCYACKQGCACMLKYWKELEVDVDDEGNPYYCGVCEKLVISGQPAYACQFCTLTLHQSCADNVDFSIIQGRIEDIGLLRSYPKHLPGGGHSCKSCLEQGKGGFTLGCKACAFQTHLKCRVLPTILNHDCHHHSLSMDFFRKYKCEACGINRSGFGGLYECYICFMFYDIECLTLAREPEHEHGGHKHTLKLMYSRDGVLDKEEPYWCEICYKDMDPQNWFYSCQDCPSFVAHPSCARETFKIQGLGELPQTHIIQSLPARSRRLWMYVLSFTCIVSLICLFFIYVCM